MAKVDASAFRRLLPFLVNRQRAALMSLIPLLLLGVAMSVLRPWPMKAVIDGIFFDKALWFVPDGWTELDHRFRFVLAAGAAVVLFAVVDAISGYFYIMIGAQASQKAVQRIRSAIVDRIQAMDITDHRRRSSGDLLMRVTGDVGMLREFVLSGGLEVLRHSLMLVGMVGIMFVLDWRLTLVALAVVPPLLAVIKFLTPSIKSAVKKQREKEGELATDVSEAISAIPVVQAFALERRTRDKLKRQNRSSGRAGLRAKRLEASLGRTAEIVLAVGVAIVLGYGVYRADSGALTPGDLVVFTSYVRGLYKPMRGIAGRAARLAKASACAARVVEILDYQPLILDQPGAIEAPPLSGRVAMERVDFAYEKGAPVLAGLDLEFDAGSFVALVGRSGAGKTTAAMLLARLLEPTGGAIRVDDVDIKAYTLQSVRKQIGFVLQDTILLRGTIAENIAIARPDATQDEIERAARDSGCEEFIRSFRDGYDTIVGERGATLSGGQARRISLARVLLLDPPIVILDEPMTGLDALVEEQVTRALRRVLRGRTVVLIAHRFTMLSEVDRVFVLDDGCVVESGTHHELLARDGLYRQLHNARGLDDAIPDHLSHSKGAVS